MKAACGGAAHNSCLVLPLRIKGAIMKRILLAALLVCTAGWGHAQQLGLQFAEATHDFGTIKEVNGPVQYQFTFTNNANVPVRILEVKASCGCTTPAWTEAAVPGGQQGFVMAKYDPNNRPGPFNKSLTIKTDLPGQEEVLVYIKGYVEPAPRPPEQEYPTKLGALRVRSKAMNMGRITNQAPAEKEFPVYNDGGSPLTFQEKTTTPAHITVTMVPTTLQPGEAGRIHIAYDAAAKNDLGFQSDNVVVFTDEADQPQKELYIMATIKEYFPPMTDAEKAAAPRLTIDRTLHDFASVSTGDTVTATFTLTNNGQQPLNIRKVKSNCSCATASVDAHDLPAGQSTTLRVTFNTANRLGNQQKSVTVFANDPVNPAQMVSIKASIKK